MLFNAKMNDETEHNPVFPHLKSVRRISRIPVVESTWDIASGVYTKIKGSNRLIAWGLGTAESSVHVAVVISRPFVNILEKPLGLVDGLVCKSLDIVEEKVPAISLPPELIVVSTREYVKTNLVQPMLKRADTLKQLGVEKATHALESKYAEFAAAHIDTALDVADRYIDQYLPDSGEKGDTPNNVMNDVDGIKALRTLHHVDLVTRKLQRRMSQKTMHELEGVKKSIHDTIQALLYVLETTAQDPKTALEEAFKLLAASCETELNIQTPPANLKQWIVEITQRFNRRLLQLMNYIHSKHVDNNGKEIKPANTEQWLYMVIHETVQQLAEIIHVAIRLSADVSHDVVLPLYQQTVGILRKFLGITNSYMKATVVQPVLKRTNSFKQFSLEKASLILDSKYAEFAADRLDSALDVADKYIDQYLPDDLPAQQKPPDDHFHSANDVAGSKAKQTIHHVDKFSRKLQRRLTQRTLMEARAFKQGGEDTLQQLILLAELLARDPKAVYQMTLDLWARLSEDEPENQVPPANLEQLLVIVIRETARRFVHLANYTQNGLAHLPQRMSILMHRLLIFLEQLRDFLIKASHFEEAKYMVISEANSQIAHTGKLLEEINGYMRQILEFVPMNISSKPELLKSSEQSVNCSTNQLQNDHLNSID